MVGGEHDHGVVGVTARLEGRQDLADPLVGVAHRREVGAPGAADLAPRSAAARRSRTSRAGAGCVDPTPGLSRLRPTVHTVVHSQSRERTSHGSCGLVNDTVRKNGRRRHPLAARGAFGRRGTTPRRRSRSASPTRAPRPARGSRCCGTRAAAPPRSRHSGVQSKLARDRRRSSGAPRSRAAGSVPGRQQDRPHPHRLACGNPWRAAGFRPDGRRHREPCPAVGCRPNAGPPPLGAAVPFTAEFAQLTEDIANLRQTGRFGERTQAPARRQLDRD